jgi:hypothetical protein
LGAGAHVQGIIGRANPQIPEEDVGQFGVIVLARVDKSWVDTVSTLTLPKEGSNFHKIWPGTRHKEDLQEMLLSEYEASTVPFGVPIT